MNLGRRPVAGSAGLGANVVIDMSGQGGRQDEGEDFGISSAKTSSGLRMVRPTGELDVYTVPRLVGFVESLCDDGVTEVCLDLSQLRFIDSRGLGSLVSLTKRLREAGGHLSLAAPSAALQRLFTISGIDQVVDIVELPVYEPPA